MIKGLTGSNGVTVGAGNTSVPYINQNTNNPVTGMMRIWGTDMQVFDGSSWLNMNASYATVGLDDDTRSLLEWARTQRQLDLNRQTLIKNNPALEKAYEAVKRAEANFDLLAKFVEEDSNDTQVQASP